MDDHDHFEKLAGQIERALRKAMANLPAREVGFICNELRLMGQLADTHRQNAAAARLAEVAIEKAKAPPEDQQ